MAKLTLVPTPIGNLEDITLRALKVLEEVDVIFAEDTRVSSKLLKHFNIHKKLSPFHQHNEHFLVDKISDEIVLGKNIALLSDAGTPGISDPGYLLVKKCIDKGLEIETLPGATAFIPALINSGLPCDKFCFEGFLPVKKGRTKRLQKLSLEDRTMIFYESPHRIAKTLEQFLEVFGEQRRVSVSRELTKIYEETIRGTLIDVVQFFKNNTKKGEFVVILEGISKVEKKRQV